MSAEAAEVLSKRGKKATAAYIQSVYSSKRNSDVANEVLNSVLNPSIRIDNWDSIDWCRWILAGGQTPDEYAQMVRTYDSATTCGLVWTANFVAYRCRTCGISQCMSLCSECFQRGDHRGHDFNMFRSQAGGACDCGDKSVMKESGFCQRHGLQNQMNKPEAPPDLMCVADILMPRIFLRLVQHLRDNNDPDQLHSAMHAADGFLTMLQTYSEMGAAMRDVMTRALINPQIYYMLAVEWDPKRRDPCKKDNLVHYLNARDSLDRDLVDIDDKAAWSVVDELKQSSFLDELVFWTIKFEFPQKLVCLLLNMMPDLTYKEAFTKIFVNHYGRISVMLAKSKDSDTLSNRVVHVSVQLFSNEALAHQMTKEYNLLQVMVKSLNSMMLSISQKSILQYPDKNEHMVVDCGHHIMKEHCYWPLVSDLNNVLTHAAVAYEFLGNRELLSEWFKFLSLFQGMNVNQREMKAHVEFESNTYYAAFSAELEASATPMWALISHLKSADTLEKTKVVLSICTQALQDWFNAVGFSPGEEINSLQVSFHIPLHRCFASFLGLAVRQQGASLDSLLPPDETLKLMMLHPLQAQVAFHEILCNMWVRNGLQIKGQAMTYIQCHFCNSIVDADLFLLQICAMKLDPDYFLKTVMERFHVWDWLSFHPTRNNTFLESDKVIPMLEGALSFLCTLLSTRTNIGQTEEEITRQEMVSLLCMSDRTHSQLMELLPDKCGETAMSKNFESILNQVADYKAPNFEATGAMMQGTYVPKPNIWENEYDPIHVLLRAVHRREYQSSLDRYTEYLRQCNKFSSSRPPWPPFRIPPPVNNEFRDPCRILQCKTLHGIIFTILHRAVNDPEIPEQVLSFCIYLLDMAIRFPSSEPPSAKKQESKEVEDHKYEGWFDSCNTLQNVTQEIDSVVITEKVVMSMRMVEEMEVDEEAEEEMEMVLEGYTVYDVHSPIVEEDYPEASTNQPTLPPTTTQLALPAVAASSVTSTSSEYTQVVPFAGTVEEYIATASTSTPTTSSSSLPSNVPVPQLALPAGSSSYNMALIPTSEGLTTLRPKCMKLKQVPGRHTMLLSDKGLPLAIGSSETQNCSGMQRYHSFSNKRSIDIRESILSLLLKLHSKLSEKPDSFKPKENTPPVQEDSRIGNDTTFIERLLDRIVASGEDKLSAVERTRLRVWPKEKDVTMSPASESLDKEERRRRAKERQKRLMAEFASKQKAFMQKAMETDAKESDPSAFEDPTPEVKKEYECVICSQMSSSEEDRPVGMVVLLQATSVAGHFHEKSGRKLPCDEKDILQLQKGLNKITLIKNKIEILKKHFSPSHWPMALNIGWEGGVHVQTCGHYLHIDCHKAYIQSLKSQNQISSRLQNLNVEQGEYFCPLCRQLANSVIPLRPDFKESSALVQYSEQNMQNLIHEVSGLLSSPLSERDSNLLKKYMGGIMEDITNATYPKYRSLCSPNSSSLFLFVCSIARTNLEIELIQRGSFYEVPKKKSCFVPLLNILSLHSILLSQTMDKNERMDYAAKVWNRLTMNSPEQSDLYFLTVFKAEVPLLIRDPIALLLQIILTLPMNTDKAIFKCVVQVLFCFLYIQALVCLSKQLSRSSLDLETWLNLQSYARDITCDDEKSKVSEPNNLKYLLGCVINCLEPRNFYVKNDTKADEETNDECLHELPDSSLENYVQNYCLHFLKIAALLQSHLFEEDIKMSVGDNEFQFLSTFLGLNTQPAGVEFVSTSLLPSTVLEPLNLMKNLCYEYGSFITQTPIGKDLLQFYVKWNPPSLLKLPQNYDDIFKYYHRKPCSVCHSEPKDPSLCLVCGTMVCLRENCCRQQAHYEAVLHSVGCGAGTAIYLAVHSSTIIVIRGKRACLWGSVYLDSYGEEDRDLKRGKPLYLSEDRYLLLQQQWINHSFDHTNKRWVWHKDNL